MFMRSEIMALKNKFKLDIKKDCHNPNALSFLLLIFFALTSSKVVFNHMQMIRPACLC